MSAQEFFVDGVRTAAPPPEGWTGTLDLDNPAKTSVTEHYVIFGLMGPLALIALGQRFYTKIFLSKGLAVDDAFMFLAWATSVTTQALMVHSVADNYLGNHMWEVRYDVFLRNQVTVYVTAGIFMMCNGFTKLSLLTFYLQLSPQRWWKIAIWASITVVSLAAVIITVMLYVHCSPVAKAYDLTMPADQGSCVDVTTLYIATAVANIATDILLFLLPIPMVIGLKMSKFQKAGAILIFGIGSMTVATSAIRLVYLMPVLNENDLSWNAARANVWSLVEANLFVICGSMPTLRKFFKHFAPRLMGGSSGVSSAAKYGTNGYGRSVGDRRLESGVGASRKMRRQYENFDDHELAMFDTRARASDDKNPVTTETNIDADGDKIADNSSDKAILQTKTFDVRYD